LSVFYQHDGPPPKHFFNQQQMKKFLLGLFVLVCLSCKESGVKLALPSTFVHYYNGGTPDIAQSIIKTNVPNANGTGTTGGYLVLANTQTALTSTYYRIKLILVDNYGNELSKTPSLIPKVEDGSSQAVAPNYSGFGMTAIRDNSGTDTGYFIVGEEIYDDPSQNGRTQGLLMIQVDTKGALVKSATLKNTSIGAAVRGVGVTRAKNGNFYVLGQALNGASDMFLAEIDANTFVPVWTRYYGAASTTLVNKLFTFGDSIYWGGTLTDQSSQEIRWVSAQVNTGAQINNNYPEGQAFTATNPPIPINFTCNDICNYGYGYGFVGSYSTAPNSFSRIAFFRIDGNGKRVDSASYGGDKYLFKYPLPTPYQAGNSICSTQDGGFLILGTKATDISTSDTNYLLIKTDSHGVSQWTKEYGGRFIDVGAKVLQADDGGFIVLGTTNLANVESIFLMKTDSQGNIQ